MDEVSEFLVELRQLGVRLFLAEQELRFSAPKGVVTPVIMARLKAQKTGLTLLLQQAAATEEERTEPLRPFATGSAVPLSFAQQRLWFLFRLEGASPSYNILQASRLHGDLDITVLTRSFNYLIKRHESLRTRFAENADGVAEQIVEDRVELAISVEDFSAYTPPQKQQLLEQAKQQLSASLFDLGVAPLSRVMLIHYDQQEWLMLMVMHHIIGDGWSMGILSRELSVAYGCYADGHEPDLPAITVNYRDYTLWQQRERQTRIIGHGIKTWRRLLDNSEYRLELSNSKPRPATRSYAGATYPLALEPVLGQQLESLADAHGVSLFVVLLTAYFVLLQRYSGRNDLLVGTQAANRNESALEPLVGFFINTLPLRARIDGNPCFTELLLQVRDFCLQAFELQTVPFERLVDAVKPERDFGYNPLVQIMFLWQNAPIADIALQGLTISREPLHSSAAKFDLTLELGMEQGQIQGVFEYSTDLFDASAIAAMAAQYKHVLLGVVAAPQTTLAGLRLDGGIVMPAHQPCDDGLLPYANIIAAFDAQVGLNPDAPAINDGAGQLTYRQLSEQAQRIALRLQHAGVVDGDVVAINLPRSNAYIVAMLGVLSAGCAYLPLEPSLPRARMQYILHDAAVAAVVGDKHEFTEFPHISCAGLDEDIGYAQRAVSIYPQSPAYVIYTSGSTGQPKGVWIEHRSVLALTRALQREIYQRYQQPANVALMASFIFDASVQQIFAALCLGHCLHICAAEARREGRALLAFLTEHSIQVSDCTPSLLQIMQDAGLVDVGGLALEQLIVGGEALPPDLIAALAQGRNAGRIQISNVYGPTECTVDSTLHPVCYQRTYPGSAVTLGTPLAHARIKIADSYGNAQPAGLVGEIYIGGAAVGGGYWRKPALTAERFVPAENGARWYRSGDKGYYNDNAEIEFLGRKDNQVKIRGFRIELGEVEAQLLKQPAILQAAVTVHQGEVNELVAYLVVAGQTRVADLRSGLAEQLPDYMIPAHFILLDAMPLNASGKLDRKALPAPSVGQRLSDALGGVPKGGRETVLAQIWCAVLGIDVIGRDDNFFASGGDSIKALQIVSRLRQSGWQLEVRDLFTHPSISKLAPKLKAINDRQPDSGHRPEGDVPLSAIQQHFFQVHGVHFGHFNQAFLLRAEAIDLGRFKQALTLVCAHHDAFRLRYRHDGQGWRQYYSDNTGFELTVLEQVTNESLSTHAAAVQQSFDLTAGPLFKVVCYGHADGVHVLLVAHHLIIDGVSWRILMEDLHDAYQQGDAWQAPAPTASFQAWMRHVGQQGATLMAQQQDYWLNHESNAHGPFMAGQGGCYRDLDTVSCEFTEADSERFLTGVHHAYQTEANDLLLAALLWAYTRWSSSQQLTLMLEGHGRDVLQDVDASRTIGWFTTRYPVSLAYYADKDVAYLIKSVKETLRAIPDKGVAYGLLRYRGNSTLAFRDPALSFNYLGQFGGQQQGLFAMADEAIGDMMSPAASPPYHIEFVGKHVGGKLSFEVAYQRHLYTQGQVTELLAHFKQALLDIMAHAADCAAPSLTPSDIDYDGFDIEQLDDFLAQLE
ncbi:MAG: amino acid adenylation domain-containing protein [Methylovulum sp.]|nr:amino acid adenylation domain-containing protein [Methylovulum sp.]